MNWSLHVDCRKRFSVPDKFHASGFRNDWNHVVSEDHEQNCRENLLCILAFALQMLPMKSFNLHVLQGMISPNFPGLRI